MNERTKKFVEIVERTPWTPKLKRELFQKDALDYLRLESDEGRFNILDASIFQRLNGQAKLHQDINTKMLGNINPAPAPFKTPKKKELMDIAAGFVGGNDTRLAMGFVFVHGSDIVATDGRILVRLENDGKYPDGLYKKVFTDYIKEKDAPDYIVWEQVIPASFDVKTSAESLIDCMGKLIALQNIDKESRVVLNIGGNEYVFIVKRLAMGIRAMLETGVEKGEIVLEVSVDKFTIMKLTADKHYVVLAGAEIEDGMTRTNININ